MLLEEGPVIIVIVRFIEHNQLKTIKIAREAIA